MTLRIRTDRRSGVVGPTVLALLYVRFGLDDGPVSVPDGAAAGDLILEDCDYATENGAYDAECGTLVVRETRRPAVAAQRVAG